MWPWGSGSSSAWPRRYRWVGEACSRSSAWTRRTWPSRSCPFRPTGCRRSGRSWTPPTRRWSRRGGEHLWTPGRTWRAAARPPAPPCTRPRLCALLWPTGGSSPCPGRWWGGSRGRRSSPSRCPAAGSGADSRLLGEGKGYCDLQSSSIFVFCVIFLCLRSLSKCLYQTKLNGVIQKWSF